MAVRCGNDNLTHSVVGIFGRSADRPTRSKFGVQAVDIIDLQIAEPVVRTKRSPMKIQPSENALLIRTDFSDESAWQKLLSEVRDPADPFIFNMEIVDNGANSSATVDQLMEAIPETYPYSFMVVADSMAISQPEHPLLVVDLFEERGRQFRAVAAQVALIDNNLSISNMDFQEFAELVDDAGVFHGIPEP